jgi:hypothetical protein
MFSEQLDGVVQNVIQWITDNFSAESAMGISSVVWVSVFLILSLGSWSAFICQ